MCWNGPASTALATAGIATTCYAIYRKEPMPLWIALGYFSMMEALQAFTYSVINQCSNPSNQIATLLGYLHITFQPFFINAVSMYFIDQRVAKKIAPFAYAVCFVSAIIMLIQLYPFDWAGVCHVGRPLCGKILCSVRGNWHIAWLVPTNGIFNRLAELNLVPFEDGFPTYVIAGFLMPLLYGSWRCTLYHISFMEIAWRTTTNINEWPAIWCLFSIGLLIIVVKTPVRQMLFVKRWPLWNRIIDSSS